MKNRRDSLPIILQKINESEDVLQALKDRVADPALKNVFGYAFIPRGKFLLPEGIPPYKSDDSILDLTVSHLAFETKHFGRFIREDLTNTKREQLYIQLLESLHKTEVDLMELIKSQTLDSVYKNITLDKIVDAGFFTWPEGIGREEYMLQKFQAEVTKLKKELPKSVVGESLELNSGIQPQKSRGRPKKIVS